MKKLKLRDIIKNITTDSNYNIDIDVNGVSIDTRTINKGDIFIALKGKIYDGHNFIKVAEQKGACAIISSEKIDSSLPVIMVKDTLKALQQLASYYRHSLENLKVIAVTGSNGKTTTKNMVSTVLSSKYKVFSTDRNYNNEIGLPMSIFEIDDTYEFAVLEMGMNHLGEIKTLSDIAKPDIAVVTNIGKAHIGNLVSQENILQAKLEITSGLKNNGTLILSSDDKFLKNIKSEKFKVLFVGCNSLSNNYLCATNIESNNNSINFEVEYQNKIFSCSIPVLGKHNVINSLIAICCGEHFGINIENSIKSLQHYLPSPMRCEKSEINGITIIKDYYNSSPESVKCAIEVLSKYKTNGKKIAILGQMSELGLESENEHFNLGDLCKDKKISHSFFIGKDFKCFENGVETNCTCYNENERIYFLESIRKYIEEKNITSGDIILIKGSRNMKMEEIYECLRSYLNSLNNNINLSTQSDTRLYVDVNAIKFNYSQIQKFVGEKIELLPMVKANAYGAGSNIISNIFQNSTYLAVADIQEANCIKNILPNSNIIIIYQPRFEDIQEIVNMNFIPAISDIDFAKQLDKVARLQNKIIRIHVEVNTGHSRLGIDIENVTKFAQEILKLKNIKVEGIFMHYSSADSYDDSDIEFTNMQTSLFDKAISDFENIYGNVKYKHACAGAALFNQEAKLHNMVRPGYILYGYYPNEEIRKKIILKPSLRLTSTILQIREVDENTPISYNRRFITKRKSKIATVSIGYSDGLPRKLFNIKNKNNGCFIINGQRAPIVGNICMDLTMIDITDIRGNIKVGDEVAIFDNSNVTIEEIADICDTIGYEIISQISDKTPRIEVF